MIIFKTDSFYKKHIKININLVFLCFQKHVPFSVSICRVESTPDKDCDCVQCFDW